MGEKSHTNSLFDVTMASYDGAEICEPIGPYVCRRYLSVRKLSKEFGKGKVGLYRDDSLMVLNNPRGRQ